MILNLGVVTVNPVESVRDRGVILNSELSMRQHISKITQICYFHLRRIRQLRWTLDTLKLQRLVSAFILSRIDYCNAVLGSLLASTTASLQRVLKIAARLVVGHSTGNDAMRKLHWLPISHRILFKLCLFMFAVVNNTSPVYITEMTTPISALPGRGRLRSAATDMYDIAHTRTKFGDRAFSVAGPREWNSLPADINSIHELTNIKRAIKTFFQVGICGLASLLASDYLLFMSRRLWSIFGGVKGAL